MKRKKKKTLKLLSKFAPETFIIKVLHFLRLLGRLPGKGKQKTSASRSHLDLSPRVQAPDWSGYSAGT